MAKQKLVIADGHHRYETALTYRNENRARASANDPDAPWEFAMMALFNAHGSGLTILPTHRVIPQRRGLQFAALSRESRKIFRLVRLSVLSAEERETSFAEFKHELERQHSRHAIGIYAGGGSFYLFLLHRGLDMEQMLPHFTPAQRELDVILLHKLLLEKCLNITAAAVSAEQNITYVRDMHDAIAEVDRGSAQMACLLNPVRVQEVREIALAGEVMPQKSTDFYPKLLSGLVMYKLDEDL